ncbi:MAG: BolA/IbaG family iron-sulfur metabolism protein [Deltaproteobacteria bacterium]|nr:BolA/IbaG family iron-sulfur metabolism protein [Deltaproteobacteria bacterium]
MTAHPTDFQGSVEEALLTAIENALPGAHAEVRGSGGHFSLVVVSPVFEGKAMLDSHRLVYSAIAPLMSGDRAPVHAIDSLITRAR